MNGVVAVLSETSARQSVDRSFGFLHASELESRINRSINAADVVVIIIFDLAHYTFVFRCNFICDLLTQCDVMDEKTSVPFRYCMYAQLSAIVTASQLHQ